MHIKVRGGTIDHGQRPLCETCRWSTIVRGTKLNDEIVECAQLSYRNRRVTFPVTFCSDYKDRRQASLREMEEIAWVLRSDPHRSSVGFVRSSRLTDEERFVLEED